MGRDRPGRTGIACSCRSVRRTPGAAPVRGNRDLVPAADIELGPGEVGRPFGRFLDPVESPHAVERKMEWRRLPRALPRRLGIRVWHQRAVGRLFVLPEYLRVLPLWGLRCHSFASSVIGVREKSG